MPDFLDLHSRTTKALRALADEGMRRHGLHYGQHHLLAALWEQDGRTPGEVAARLHVTTPTVVKMADRMTASGLLERRRDERDARLVRLWLTDAGAGAARAGRVRTAGAGAAGDGGASPRPSRDRLTAALGTVLHTAEELLGGRDAGPPGRRRRQTPSPASRSSSSLTSVAR